MKIKKATKRKTIGCFIILLFLIWCIVFAQWIYRVGEPIISAHAKQELNRQWNLFIQSTLESKVSQQEYVTVHYDNNEKIQFVMTNTVKVNQFKNEFLTAYFDFSQDQGTVKLRIPIGTLCENPLLYAKGPKVTVEVLPCTDARVTVKDRFESGGINQTLHTLSLELDATITILTPGGALDYQFTEEVLLAQTWIIGSTPSVYPFGNG